MNAGLFNTLLIAMLPCSALPRLLARQGTGDVLDASTAYVNSA